MNQREAIFQVALKYHQQGQLEKARALYHKILDLEPTHLKSLQGLSLLISEQTFPKTLTYLKQGLVQSQEWEILVLIGDVYRKTNQSQLALQTYQSALIIRSSPLLHQQIAKLYVELGQLLEGLTHYQQAALLEPQNVLSYYGMGTVYFTQEKWELAQAVFLKILQIDTEQTKAYYYLGQICEKKSQLEKACDYYQQSLAIQRDYPESLLALANLSVTQNKKQEAIRYFEQFYQAKPQPLIAFALMCLYNNLKEFGMALNYALQLKPESQTLPEQDNWGFDFEYKSYLQVQTAYNQYLGNPIPPVW